MSRIAALVLTAGAVIWVRGLGSAGPTGSAGTALALGFALVGAWVTGDLLRRFNLPRLTGYLLFGIVVGPQVANVITESMAGQLQVITGHRHDADRADRGTDAESRAHGPTARGHRADDRRHAGARDGRPGRPPLDRVAVAAGRTECDRRCEAGDARAVGRDPRQLLADDDRRGDHRHRAREAA